MNEIGEAFIVFVLALILSAMLLGFPIMWLWNWLMPDLFGLQTITFWQAIGLYILCSLLFKSAKGTKDK